MPSRDVEIPEVIVKRTVAGKDYYALSPQVQELNRKTTREQITDAEQPASVRVGEAQLTLPSVRFIKGTDGPSADAWVKNVLAQGFAVIGVNNDKAVCEPSCIDRFMVGDLQAASALSMADMTGLVIFEPEVWREQQPAKSAVPPSRMNPWVLGGALAIGGVVIGYALLRQPDTASEAAT